MGHAKRIIISLILAIGLLTHFNSCDVYSDNSAFQNFASTCEGSDCLQESSDLLALKINHDSQSGNICVNSSVNHFNVAGECNEGGYPNNEITWSLYNSTGFIHNSQALGLSFRCVNGIFSISVQLNNPSLPNVERTGLRNGNGVFVDHRLEVEIRGIDATGGQHENSLAKRSVTLKPVGAGNAACQ